MTVTVTRSDPRYPALRRGHNLRWPLHDADAAQRILLCEDAEDTAAALQQVVTAGLRPTVRSGGHCYEDFVVNNPGGAILDVSALSRVDRDGSNGAFHLGAGVQLGNGYETLYKRFGVTLPGGVCGTVGAGGHISGGGYGPLSRLHGLSCDWVTAVNILTVDRHGKVVPLRADAASHPDLFRACRGAGGASFGLITGFEFATLPIAPREVVLARISFSWSDMTLERFTGILTTFGEYWESRGQERDTWGMYSVLELSHRSAKTFGVSVQFCNPDGTCHDLSIMSEYLDLFSKWSSEIDRNALGRESARPSINQNDWLNTCAINAGNAINRRGKYKSAYMRRGFILAEAAIIYKYLTKDVEGTSLHEASFDAHSYGGAANRRGMAEQTAISQRDSILKLQPLTYWEKPEEDAAQIKWLAEFYKELYSGPNADPQHLGTPYWSDRYQGCYINYPDADMLQYDYWPQLYYGESNYAFLQTVKRRYDPNNIFHHAMSVRL
jgi:FAD/FMN-containing dehydrogenase